MPILQRPAVVSKRERKSQPKAVSPAETSAAEDKWPAHATLILPADKGKDISLRPQHSLIQLVVHNSIAQVTTEFALHSAWPEATARGAYGKGIVEKACQQEAEANPKVSDIQNRINADASFRKALANLVCFLFYIELLAFL
jgi:hypothetical protein